MTIDTARPTPGALRDDEIEIRFVDTGPAFAQVTRIRSVVFREEQRLVDLPVSDHQDPLSVQVLALVGGKAVGCGRLTPALHGHQPYIAWVATLPAYRRMGIGTRIVQELVEVADRAGMPVVTLSAQTHAQGIYERLGFRVTETPFTMRGIEHVMMERTKRQVASGK